MKIHGQPFRTIWWDDTQQCVGIIDQSLLPHRFETARLAGLRDVAQAIRDMRVRGAPLIGVAAAFGLALAMREDPGDAGLDAACALLAATRPTAVNLRRALSDMGALLRGLPEGRRHAGAVEEARQMAERDVEVCRRIGAFGADLLEAAWRRRGGERPLNVLTHCNAGWLGTVDWGTALAPLYMAHDRGLPLHVWVDETRPRNQGSFLTALELGWHGVPHTVIVDNAGGHLMQRGEVDLCIVGADRVTATGDTANKIGTYLKALAARDNGVPFYVALPSSTIDWSLTDGVQGIEIEERGAHEVLTLTGLGGDGRLATVALAPPGSRARNPGFDVTPSRLVTAFITERGVCGPHALASLFEGGAAASAARDKE